MRTINKLAQNTALVESDLKGLDAYSADGQPVGRVDGFLEQVPEDETELAETPVDTIARGAERHGARRVLIDGHGYISQVNIIIPLNQLEIDLRGRRVRLPLTMAQIEQMPRHRPDEPDLTP